MHTVLQHLRRGRMGAMCPPVTLLLLLATAPWPGEMTALCRFRHVVMMHVLSYVAASRHIHDIVHAAAGRFGSSIVGHSEYCTI